MSYPRLRLDGPASFVGFKSRARLTAARVLLTGPSMSRVSHVLRSFHLPENPHGCW